MNRLAVIDVVGLTPDSLARMPGLGRLAAEGWTAPLEPTLPAVTCTSQATMLTGKLPRQHGIVGNGWYFRDLAQVWLWRQSNHLVLSDEVQDEAARRHPAFKCARLFWWHNMYSSADIVVTPRPAYAADGLKHPDLYSTPPQLARSLQAARGRFPLFDFWGPGAGIRSSEWIAGAALDVARDHRPALLFVYLPHLDYDLQRFGPGQARSLAAMARIDEVASSLYAALQKEGYEILVVSEYGIEAVDTPVHVNRALRAAGLLRVHEQRIGEVLDAGASDAFAVADHQLAHVYVRDPARLPEVRALLEGLEGVGEVLDDEGKRARGLDHPRSGELVAVARSGAWFTYYYWIDDDRAPDFARTVAIHDKPGYDPCELFLDPARRLVGLRILWKLLRKRLGLRYTMDVVPLDASLVKGSHGRLPGADAEGPLVIAPDSIPPRTRLKMTEVRELILDCLYCEAS